MDHHEWKKTDTLLASALDGVWCTMSSHYPYTLSPLSIHQYVHVWGWYTITQATKQGDHINTGHTILQRCTMGRWMKTGTRLSLALDIVWYTISSNNPYICFHPSQFINGCMDEFGSPLYKQPNKGITYILATQHPKDVPWVDGWKLGHFHPLPWMVCDTPWVPTIQTGDNTPINSSMNACVRLTHQYTSNQARGSHPYWLYNSQRRQAIGKLSS